MLLRNSISNTKKFFQKTIDNVKSFLSIGSTYQRLPKTPPFHPFSCGRDTNEIDGNNKYNNNNNELDYFYSEFTNQWDSHKSKSKNKPQKKKIRASTTTTQHVPTKVRSEEDKIRASAKENQQFFLDDSCQKENCNIYAARTEENIKTPEKNGDFNKGGYISNEHNIEKNAFKSKKFNLSPGKMMQKTDLCSRSVREKRLCFVAEKLKELEVIDKGNVDHKLDFEEFLHYYSRLTCPAYLDIVDKFLMEMCREFFGPQTSPKVNYSRHVLQALKV